MAGAVLLQQRPDVMLPDDPQPRFIQVGFTTIDDVDAQIKTASAGAVANAFYDTSTNKLLAYTTTAQVGNGTDLSGVTVRLRVYGR